MWANKANYILNHFDPIFKGFAKSGNPLVWHTNLPIFYLTEQDSSPQILENCNILCYFAVLKNLIYSI